MKEEQQAATEPVPPIKTAWLSIKCFPDEKHPDLMRLKISLDINGQPWRYMEDTIFDTKSGNGILCSDSNLTWMFHQTERYLELSMHLEKAREIMKELVDPDSSTVNYELWLKSTEHLFSGSEK